MVPLHSEHDARHRPVLRYLLSVDASSIRQSCPPQRGEQESERRARTGSMFKLLCPRQPAVMDMERVLVRLQALRRHLDGYHGPEESGTQLALQATSAQLGAH